MTGEVLDEDESMEDNVDEFQCEDCMHWNPQDSCYLAKDPGEYQCSFFTLKETIKESRYKQPTLERWL